MKDSAEAGKESGELGRLRIYFKKKKKWRHKGEKPGRRDSFMMSKVNLE